MTNEQEAWTKLAIDVLNEGNRRPCDKIAITSKQEVIRRFQEA
jgi:hypothetical protein